MENTINIVDGKKVIKPDWAFFLYFSVMFLLYTKTYIQLGIQIFIILYVIVDKLKTNYIRLKVITLKNIALVFLWIGLLTLLLVVSRYSWARYIINGSKTLTGTVRVFAICVMIALYIDSKERLISVLQSFMYATVVLGIGAMLTTPLSGYFQAGNEGFGQALGQQRNGVGALTASMAAVSYYFTNNKIIKNGYYLLGFFVIITVLTGSRGALTQLVIEFAFILSLDTNVYRMLLKLVFIAIGVGIIVLILKNVPILYSNIWSRFDDMITTISGDEVADTSTLGRHYYKEIAYEMFKKHSLLGWGVDGFTAYLIQHPIYKGSHIRAVYSHCNYAELAADLGIVGLVTWYAPTLFMLAKSLKNIRRNPLVEMSCFWLLSMIVLDYARIPWSTHPSTYLYVLAFLTIQFGSIRTKEIKGDTENGQS